MTRIDIFAALKRVTVRLVADGNNNNNNQAENGMKKAIDRVPQVIRTLKTPEKDIRLNLHIQGNFHFPNQELQEAVCKLLIEKYPCESLQLENMMDDIIESSSSSSGIIDPLVKEVLVKAASASGGKCDRLKLIGNFSDNAILTLSDFLQQNGGVQHLDLENVQISEMAAALLSRTKLAKDVKVSEHVGFWRMNHIQDNSLARLVENLGNFKTVAFWRILRTSLCDKPLTWQAFGQVLAMQECKISSLKLCGTLLQGEDDDGLEKPCPREDDRLTLMLESMKTTNKSLKILNLSYNHLTESELFSLSRNLFKFTQLEFLEVDVRQVSNFEFLKPLLIGNDDASCKGEKEDGSHPLSPVPVSLKQITFSNDFTHDLTICKQDETMLVHLLEENEKLTGIVGVGKSSLLNHHLRMNSKWRKFLSTSDSSSILPSLWPLVIAAVEREHQTKDGDEVVASIRYCMIHNLVSHDDNLNNPTMTMMMSGMEKHNNDARKMDEEAAGSAQPLAGRKRKMEDDSK